MRGMCFISSRAIRVNIAAGRGAAAPRPVFPPGGRGASSSAAAEDAVSPLERRAPGVSDCVSPGAFYAGRARKLAFALRAPEFRARDL